MTNTYRIKENIVHMSMNAGMLLQNSAIEVDSSVLTEFIIDMADTFEEKVVPTLEDGGYLEAIDLYSNKELLKQFAIANFYEIHSMYHSNDNTATHYFYVKEDEIFEEKSGKKKLKQLYKNTIRVYLLRKGYKFIFEQMGYEDSVLTVKVKYEEAR